MWAYILRRLLLAIVTLLGSLLAAFMLMLLLPEKDILFVPTFDPEVAALIRVELGLDRPLHTQFMDWLLGILRFDFGRSWFYNADISLMLTRKLPISLQIGIMGLIIGSTLGVAGGIVAALKPDGVVDNLVRGIAILGISLPTFFTGMVLILIMVRAFDWIPQQGYIPLTSDPLGNLSQLIWPTLVVGLGMIMGTVLRLMRASLLEALSSDYVRLARGKGMRERIVLLRHALPNAMIPTATIIGAFVPIVFVGLILTEQVFGLPGIGRMLVDAIQQRDYPVVQTVITLSAIVVILANLGVDMLYVRLDPRIRY